MTSSYVDAHVDAYLEKKGEYMHALNYAIVNGDLTVVKFFLDGDKDMLLYKNNPFTDYYVNAVANGGNLKILKALHAKNFAWNSSTCEVSANNGYITCLRFAHKNGCPWNTYEMCEYAVCNISKHIKIRNPNICEEGKLTCLKYAHKNGCIMTEKVFILCVKNGYLKCLKYAYTTGVQWDKKQCLYIAIANNNYEIVSYINTKL